MPNLARFCNPRTAIVESVKGANQDDEITQIARVTLAWFTGLPDLNGLLINIGGMWIHFLSEAKLWSCACANQLSAEQLRRIGETAQTIDTEHQKTVIVINIDCDFGLNRMFLVHRENA